MAVVKRNIKSRKKAKAEASRRNKNKLSKMQYRAQKTKGGWTIYANRRKK